MNNYWRLRRFSFLHYYYAYLDTEENLADQLFISHKVHVSFGKELVKEGSPYKVILCKVRKEDETPFLDALAELDNRMLLFGHTDYRKFCEEIKSLTRN